MSFLGLTPGSHTAALSLFWGSILTVSPRELILLAIMAGVMLLLLILFFKEIQAVLCHREVALAVGIPATLIFYGMLFATGSAIALSLRSIGGLLIYSLVLNPAAAAYQLTYNLKIMMALAMLFGVFSSWIGLFASYYWDLPTGATIVLTTAAIFAVASLISPKRKVQPMESHTHRAMNPSIAAFFDRHAKNWEKSICPEHQPRLSHTVAGPAISAPACASSTLARAMAS